MDNYTNQTKLPVTLKLSNGTTLVVKPLETVFCQPGITNIKHVSTGWRKFEGGTLISNQEFNRLLR